MDSKEGRVMDVGNVVSWSHPKINLSRVHNRFKNDTKTVHRLYSEYLWDTSERLYPSGDPQYNELWSQLIIGKRYVVSLADCNRDVVLGANVMHFMGYRAITDTELVAARKAGIDMKIRLAKKYREYLSDLMDEGEEDPEEDEDVEDMYYKCRRAVKNLRVYGAVMSRTLLRFKCTESGRVYDMDPCGIDHRHRFHVMDIDFRGWSYICRVNSYENGEWIYHGTDNTQAQTSMRRLDAGYAQHIRREVAALRIQRQWKKARMVPAFHLCRKRLRDEFESDISM